MKCPNCGAPARTGSIDCDACGCALPDSDGRRALVAVLRALDEELKGAWNARMYAWLLMVFVGPIVAAVAGWHYEHLLGGIGIAVVVLLFGFMMLGFELDRAKDRMFAEKTRARLDEVARENGLTRTALVGIVIDELPSGSDLRKRVGSA